MTLETAPHQPCDTWDGCLTQHHTQFLRHYPIQEQEMDNIESSFYIPAFNELTDKICFITHQLFLYCSYHLPVNQQKRNEGRFSLQSQILGTRVVHLTAHFVHVPVQQILKGLYSTTCSCSAAEGTGDCNSRIAPGTV